MQKWMYDYHAPDQEPVQSATELLDLVLDILNLEHGKLVEPALYTVSYNRKLFITSEGRRGLRPAYLEPFDTICLLFGGDSLYALRPIKGTGQYLFLGECYVHGLMSVRSHKGL
jgi:hypothetical protein